MQVYSSMTAALEGGEWSAARPGRTLSPGKTRYPFYRRLGGLQGRSGRGKISSPPGFDPGPSSPYSVAIPTQPTGSQEYIYIYIFIYLFINITYITCRLSQSFTLCQLFNKIDGGHSKRRIQVKPHDQICTYMTLIYAIVSNFQSSMYQHLNFCIIIIIIIIIRFKATQRRNKRNWIVSDQFCSST